MNVAQRIEAIIEAADQKFIKKIGFTQRAIYNQFLRLFKDLELDDEGYILTNQANRALLQKGSEVFNRAIKKSNFKGAVEEFTSNVSEIDKVNVAYFSSISEAFQPNRAFIQLLQKQTVTNIENLLLNSGLESQVKIPILNILNQNINSGGSYTGFLEQLRENIIGGVNEGKLLRYSRGIMNDSLFNYSRAYMQSVTKDLGLVFYLYSGGLTKDSRPFCVDHSDLYYHQKEIEGWAKESWEGQRPDTTESSIFIYAGGYNCKHSIIPVDVSVVPAEDITRNVDNGNYTP